MQQAATTTKHTNQHVVDGWSIDLSFMIIVNSSSNNQVKPVRCCRTREKQQKKKEKLWRNNFSTLNLFLCARDGCSTVTGNKIRCKNHTYHILCMITLRRPVHYYLQDHELWSVVQQVELMPSPVGWLVGWQQQQRLIVRLMTTTACVIIDD